MMRFYSGILVIIFAAMLTACASSNSGSVYSRNDTRKVESVKTGVVESVRQVKIEGTKSPVGAATGAAIGGIAGSSVGGRYESGIVGVLGALVGGIFGSMVEEGVTGKNGLEITVKLDGGAMLAIVQESDEAFHPGDKVRIIDDGNTSRVSH